MLLNSRSSLRHLVVKATCLTAGNVATLVQLRNLQSLSIGSPSRAILQVLPEWLRQLQSTLRKLGLTESCGSVTPGVLRSFLPYMHDITSFTLGLSYSLTDDDVFLFWEDLPSLQTLEFRYYLQMRPVGTPRLSHLRCLTVYCNHVKTSGDAAYLYKWVRRVITYAPLVSLRILCRREPWGAAPSFDPLLEHLIARHAQRLRVLDIREFLVGKKALSKLCDKCTQLETLFVTVSCDALKEFQSDPTVFRSLRQLGLNTRTSKSRRSISTTAAEAFMKRLPSLRRLVVNGSCFEGTWAADMSEAATYVVHPVDITVRLFPWERGTVYGQPSYERPLDWFT
ncbi:hypothetical protein BD309DRAFT_972136 [Dichomitus squalens]|nr:hypothetical protein BD309DRAFT_972136 [Dichomitus squalens]